jgi:chromosome segregation ATPase
VASNLQAELDAERVKLEEALMREADTVTEMENQLTTVQQELDQSRIRLVESEDTIMKLQDQLRAQPLVSVDSSSSTRNIPVGFSDALQNKLSFAQNELDNTQESLREAQDVSTKLQMDLENEKTKLEDALIREADIVTDMDNRLSELREKLDDTQQRLQDREGMCARLQAELSTEKFNVQQALRNEAIVERRMEDMHKQMVTALDGAQEGLREAEDVSTMLQSELEIERSKLEEALVREADIVTDMENQRNAVQDELDNTLQRLRDVEAKCAQLQADLESEKNVAKATKRSGGVKEGSLDSMRDLQLPQTRLQDAKIEVAGQKAHLDRAASDIVEIREHQEQSVQDLEKQVAAALQEELNISLQGQRQAEERFVTLQNSPLKKARTLDEAQREEKDKVVELNKQMNLMQIDLDDLQERLREAEDMCAQLQSELDKERTNLEDALEREADTVTDLENQLTALREELDEALERVRETEDTSTQLQAELESEKVKLEEALTREAETVTELQNSLDEFEAQKAQLEHHAGTVEGQLHALEGQMSKATIKIADLELTNGTLQEQLKAAEAAMRELDSDRDKFRTQLSQQRALLQQQGEANSVLKNLVSKASQDAEGAIVEVSAAKNTCLAMKDRYGKELQNIQSKLAIVLERVGNLEMNLEYEKEKLEEALEREVIYFSCVLFVFYELLLFHGPRTFNITHLRLQ